MTKAMTKAAKRNRKRMEGDREPNGRLARSESTRANQEAAMRTVIEARCRAAGLWPEPLVRAWGETQEAFDARNKARQAMIRAAVATVTQPWMGSNAGRMIAGEPDVADLWQMVQIILARRRAFLAAIDAPAETAAIASISVEPERFETRDDDGPSDLRSPEERAAAARERWGEVEAILNKIKATDFMLRAVVKDEPVPGPLARILRFLKKGLEGERLG